MLVLHISGRAWRNIGMAVAVQGKEVLLLSPNELLPD